MLGDETKVQSLAQKLNLDISNIELINPATSEFKAELVNHLLNDVKVKRLKNKRKNY